MSPSLRSFRLTLLVFALLTLLGACGANQNAGEASSVAPSPDFGFAGANEERVRLVNAVASDIQAGEVERSVEVIRANDLTAPDFQLAFFSAAGCSPTAVRDLIHKAGLDPMVEREGETTIYALTRPDFESEGTQCPESDRVAPVEVLLEAGVDPCQAPDWAPDQVPAKFALEWGRSAEMVALLRRQSNCE